MHPRHIPISDGDDTEIDNTADITHQPLHDLPTRETDSRPAVHGHMGHGGSGAAHGHHDKHAGHDPEVFRRKFWLSLVLTIPVVLSSEMVMDWFGYELS